MGYNLNKFYLDMSSNSKEKENFKGNDQLKKLVIYYVYVKQANWLLVEKAISEIEPVDEAAASEIFESVVASDFITINENDYPLNFTHAPQPPLCLFVWGNKELLNNQNGITALWGDLNLDAMIRFQLPIDVTYACIISNSNYDEIKKIIKKGYKLILVANTNYNFVKINELTMKNENVLFISEVPADVLTPNLDIDQTNEKLLYGVANDQILLKTDLDVLGNVNQLFDVSFNKVFYAVDINHYSANEVTYFDMKQYKKRTN